MLFSFFEGTNAATLFSVPDFDRNFDGVKDGMLTLKEEDAEFDGVGLADLAIDLCEGELASLDVSFRCFLARS